MSFQNGNESYTRCVAALKQKYGARGLSLGMRKSVEEEAVRETKAKVLTSDSFYTYDTRSGIASDYRSGDGGKYMTSNDFVRYFRNRHSFVIPTGRAGVDRSVVKSAASAREGSSDSKEGHIRRAVSALIELKKKWLPVESREGRTVGTKFKFPALAMSCIAVFAISLGLIVSGSVMLGNISGELGSLNTEISVLEAKRSELEGELDLKYDMELIRADAEKLGMIPGDFAGGNYLSVSSDEEIEVYEQEDREVGFAALLSAIGINLG